MIGVIGFKKKALIQFWSREPCRLPGSFNSKPIITVLPILNIRKLSLYGLFLEIIQKLIKFIIEDGDRIVSVINNGDAIHNVTRQSSCSVSSSWFYVTVAQIYNRLRILNI